LGFFQFSAKRKFLAFLTVFFAGCSASLFAQKKEITLCEVPVVGVRPERFMTGQKVQDLDSANMARNRFSTMAEFLQFQTPIAFKSYGAGQLATISFRGTAAGHTALLWNGLNINFPSLGQTDFSTIPLSGFDEMSIQYGSAASCVGTDAVGGSIQLRSTPSFKNKGIQTHVGLRAETAENFSAQGGVRFNSLLKNNFKFSGKTLLYGSSVRNNFGTKPIEKKGQTLPVEPIHTGQKGLVQDLFLLTPKGDLLSLNLWFTDNDLHIQPDVLNLREITRTQAYRSVLAYQMGKTLFRTGYIKDITDYGKGENLNPSRTEIDRYIARIEHDFSWIKDCNKGTNLKIGAEVVHYDAWVDGYGGGRKTESRADLYALLRHQFSARFSSSLNLRQAFVTGYNPPFTPSIGIEYVVFKSSKTKILLPASAARSYRVPTLNERYWEVLGNPDIQPEKGFNKEAGLVWQQKYSEVTQSKIGITTFHNLIDNWTYWNPEKNYRVENLQQVLSKGLELETSLQTSIEKTTLTFLAQYALTNASQQKEYGAYTSDIIGKQLVYVPRHAVSSTISAKRNAWTVDLQQQFNSKRYITFDHSGRPYNPFYLMNARVAYQKRIGKLVFDGGVQVNNVTDTLYPNQKRNAMPMRSMALTLVIGNF
jgi:vitamin B12 transporter